MTTAPGHTRRSLLAAAAGGGAWGLARPQGVLAALWRAAAIRRQPTPVLTAGTGRPTIIPREVWAQGRCTPRVAPEYGLVQLAFVHHTENPNGYPASAVPAMLRAIFLFHRDTHGWNDIGYNFVLDRFGRIFEARAGGIDEPVSGAQAGGYNYCSTGIAVLGEFGAQRISPATRAALARLLAWKLALHGVPIEGRVTVRVNPAGAVYSRYPANAPVTLPRVAGHRDADTTECPGNAFYAELPSLRLSAARIQRIPARSTLLLNPSPVSAAGGEAGTLSGSLAFLNRAGGTPGGPPIAGAPIEIQARIVSHRGEVVQETPVAQAQTGADGTWSLPIYSPAPGAPQIVPAGTWLRALCPGGLGVPESVSPALRVTEGFSFTPPAPPPPEAPAPTTAAAGPLAR